MSMFGITHMVNCGLGFPRLPEHHAKYGYMHIQANDHTQERFGPYFEQACDYIENALKEGGKVLIHCAAGISRSATILLAYLIHSRRWTLQKAFEFVRDKRYIIHPNKAFVSELRDWEKKCLGTTTTPPTLCATTNCIALTTEVVDWRHAIGFMFARQRAGNVVCRDTGMAHLVWDRFRAAFPAASDKHDDKVLDEILHELFKHAREDIKRHHLTPQQ
jgi:hypothetical protein